MSPSDRRTGPRQRRGHAAPSPRHAARKARVHHAIQQEVDQLIRHHLTDPALEDAEVLDAPLSPDGRQLLVVLRLVQPVAPDALSAALERAAHWLRGELATGLGLKRVPHVRLVPLDTPRPAPTDEPEGAQ